MLVIGRVATRVFLAIDSAAIVIFWFLSKRLNNAPLSLDGFLLNRGNNDRIFCAFFHLHAFDEDNRETIHYKKSFKTSSPPS